MGCKGGHDTQPQQGLEDRNAGSKKEIMEYGVRHLAGSSAGREDADLLGCPGEWPHIKIIYKMFLQSFRQGMLGVSSLWPWFCTGALKHAVYKMPIDAEAHKISCSEA